MIRNKAIDLLLNEDDLPEPVRDFIKMTVKLADEHDLAQTQVSAQAQMNNAFEQGQKQIDQTFDIYKSLVKLHEKTTRS